MQTISGIIKLPPNINSKIFNQILIELRDVSIIDSPSIVIVEKIINNVLLHPNSKIEFKMTVPKKVNNLITSFRVHVSQDGSRTVKKGDLLTVSAFPLLPTQKNSTTEIIVVLV